MPTWTNWAGDQTCTPAAIEHPATLDELRRIVSRAAESGRTVRASASGHSFTDAALTDGVMVRLDKLNRTLDFDSESGLFKAEGGAVLRELNKALHASGVAFENLGDIDRQTVAGSISTGTHGTGERFQNVSAQIAALELVTPAGELVEVTDADPELLRAARVGIGALGVVYSVTVRTVPSYTLNRLDSPKPLADTLARLDELNAGTDHFEFYVFPGTEVALCRESRRTDEPAAPRHPALVYAQEVMLENWVGGAFAQIARRFPSQAPRLSRIASKGVGRARKVDHWHKVFASERRIKFTEMEYGLPREHAREAIERVLAVASRPEHAVAFPIEVRFVKGDDSLLSPSHERDTCYIAIHQDWHLEWEPYFREVEEIHRSYGGRPHWGKRHFQTAETLAPLYPRWSEFQDARKRLDPDGVFRNGYTDRVLGVVAEAQAVE